MDYKGLLITGTSGSGKSTVSERLCEKYNSFQIVQALTTRKPRGDDILKRYEYMDEEQFENLGRKGELLIKSEYRGDHYGISTKAFQCVLDNNKIPLMIVTPESVLQIEGKQIFREQGKRAAFISVFLDASDDVLDSRLSLRGEKVNELMKEQRREDREYYGDCLYSIKNLEEKNTVELVVNLWEYRKTGGVLPNRLIKLMVDCGILLENLTYENITGAAYDLSLGDEYYYGGKIKTLADKDPFILIEPYDYAIVTSKEICNLPKDIAGRFDLSVSLFCQGMILSNGPQVDPGFRGRLFCLLFNTSNAPVVLKRGQHYATIEFQKLIEPTTGYAGKYQGKEKIVDYLPSNTMKGAINELKKELEGIKRESRNLQAIFLGTISLILAIIAILLVIK